jgi:hypothetical protein
MSKVKFSSCLTKHHAMKTYVGVELQLHVFLTSPLYADITSGSFQYNLCPSARLTLRGCIQKFPDRVDNEIYAYSNKHSLKSNTKGYGGKTH